MFWQSGPKQELTRSAQRRIRGEQAVETNCSSLVAHAGPARTKQREQYMHIFRLSIKSDCRKDFYFALLFECLDAGDSMNCRQKNRATC